MLYDALLEKVFQNPRRIQVQNIMMDMYILIVCNFDDAENVLSKIENLDVIQEGHLLNGVYDMIIKISGQSFEELERINSKIRAVVGVKATLTLTGYNPSSNSD